MPRYFRIAAVSLLGVTLLAIGFGFYSSRSKPAFRLKSEHTRLSNEIIAEVSGYERLETDGDVPKYLVKADRAVTFSDNHQELDNVFIKVFADDGVNFDKLQASKALYVPEENKNFTAYLAGQVDILTRDNLNVKTEQITYTRSNNTADSEEPVEFARENVRGRSKGAHVKIAEKRLELPSAVEIETYDATGQVREGRVTSDTASFDQASQTIEFRGQVNGNVVNGNRNIDVTADRAEVLLASTDTSPVLSSIRLYDSVSIGSYQNGTRPTKIDSAFAEYNKLSDTFDLRGGTKIETVEGEQSTNIAANEIRYEQSAGHVTLHGDAEVAQANALIKGDQIDADLNSEKKLRNAVSRGNAYLKQQSNERTTEIGASELNASFSDQQIVSIANAVGNTSAILTPVNATDYTLVRMEAPQAMHLWFKGEGLIDRMQTDGRTTIKLNVADNAPDAANKSVTADTVRTFFDAAGKYIEKAEAIGNAELFVEPLRAAAENYKTAVRAPRFDCDFFPASSNARSCVAQTKATATRVPTQPSETRLTQNINADRLTAAFSQQTRDVERMDASGNAKFSEGDRNAVADGFSYSPSEAILRLRGEPAAWDSRARAKALEIDWNTREQKSYLRGKVSTTYYNQKQSGDATPFSDSDRPVFITSDSAEFDHRSQVGVYTGNARGWQENNFVRANTIRVDQSGGKFNADGSVQSLLYNVRRRENGKETDVPVFASSQRMSYGRDSRLVRYEDNVDIRQGTDRLTGNVAQIFLDDRNEVSKSVIENNVVITQPNRRATGSYAEYTATDELVVLRGAPAVVNDAENGSSSAAELRMYMRENKVVSEAKTKPNVAGRIRSVYKVKNTP